MLILRRPPLRQQPLQLAQRHGGHAGQHAAEVGLRIDGVAFGAGDEAVERGGPFGGDIMPCEKPILPSDPHPPQGTFGGVVMCALSRHIGSSGANPDRR